MQLSVQKSTNCEVSGAFGEGFYDAACRGAQLFFVVSWQSYPFFLTGTLTERHLPRFPVPWPCPEPNHHCNSRPRIRFAGWIAHPSDAFKHAQLCLMSAVKTFVCSFLGPCDRKGQFRSHGSWFGPFQRLFNHAFFLLSQGLKHQDLHSCQRSLLQTFAIPCRPDEPHRTHRFSQNLTNRPFSLAGLFGNIWILSFSKIWFGNR